MKSKQLILIGDIIQSRKDFNPKQWQHFHEAIEAINQDFQKDLLMPMVIYSGDSFGGIINDVASTLNLVLHIQELFVPLKVRLVLIEDEVSFGMENKNFLELEGPALWKSPEKMKELKESTAYFLADLQSRTLSLSLNAALNLILAIKYDWESLEWEIYRQYPENNQKEIAQQNNVSQQYISKLIRKSKFRLVKESEKNLILLTNGSATQLD